MWEKRPINSVKFPSITFATSSQHIIHNKVFGPMNYVKVHIVSFTSTRNWMLSHIQIKINNLRSLLGIYLWFINNKKRAEKKEKRNKMKATQRQRRDVYPEDDKLTYWRIHFIVSLCFQFGYLFEVIISFCSLLKSKSINLVINYTTLMGEWTKGVVISGRCYKFQLLLI